MELARTGAIDPVEILTEVYPLSDAIGAFEAFDKREPGWINVELNAAESGRRFERRLRARRA